jgi:hypothetical protein
MGNLLGNVGVDCGGELDVTGTDVDLHVFSFYLLFKPGGWFTPPKCGQG